MADIQTINSSEDIDRAMNETTAVIFKHSTRCGISARAQREFIRFAEECGDDVSLYQVQVVEMRALSDEITERAKVEHHSPEAIFIREGSVAGFITHYNIRIDTLQEGIS